MPSPYTGLPFAQAKEQVLAVARLVPEGRIVSYGDIAALLSMSPRAVGRAMATSDAADASGPPIPWWRVMNSAGDPPPHLLEEAIARFREEGIPLKPGGRGAPIRTHRADLPSLADAAEALLGPLPGANA